MYRCRIRNLKTGQIFEKVITTTEYWNLDEKCKYSKNLQIISAIKVW